MVLLLAMLERGHDKWREPITALEAAPFFHRYLTEKEYRRKTDFSDKTTSLLTKEYNAAKVAVLIERMPMTMWSGSSNGLVTFRNGVFEINKENVPDSRVVYDWTKEICLYRLHEYFERKA